MSWDVCLRYPGADDYCEVKNHSEGGTYVLGGTPTAELNITYNYSPFYYWFLHSNDGLRFLDGKKAEDVLELLETAVDRLGCKPYRRTPDATRHDSLGRPILEYVEDYWAPTPGNAGKALSILLKWARQHPQAAFTVT